MPIDHNIFLSKSAANMVAKQNWYKQKKERKKWNKLCETVVELKPSMKYNLESRPSRRSSMKNHGENSVSWWSMMGELYERTAINEKYWTSTGKQKSPNEDKIKQKKKRIVTPWMKNILAKSNIYQYVVSTILFAIIVSWLFVYLINKHASFLQYLLWIKEKSEEYF